MKRLPALIAAFVTTAVIAIAMLLIGINAVMNPNQVAAASSPNDSQAAVSSAGTTQNGQAQDLVAQYQAREKQYQDREQQYQSQISQLEQRLNQDETQLQQAAGAIQQYQGLLQELQDRGIIMIDRNGTIYLPRGGGEENENH
jgi:biotin-(acetyl-CoA carboxylase) ligase